MHQGFQVAQAAQGDPKEKTRQTALDSAHWQQRMGSSSHSTIPPAAVGMDSPRLRGGVP